MEVLDTSIANVALPHIAGGLSATQDESTWVLTSYLVSNAIILPISAWLSVLVGRKRFYMTCVTLFTISSFLCGFAQSLGMLVVFRVMQGFGGGGLATSEQSILADTFTPEKRGMAFAVYGMAVVLAPAIGPTLGGWITDNYTWRWIFYINVPVGLLSLYLTHKIVEDPPYIENERQKMLKNPIDYIGLGLITVGMGCLQVVLDKGQEDDWFSSRLILTMSVLSVTMIGWFLVNEWNHRNPIVDIKLLKQRNFATAVLMMFVLGMVLFGTTVLIPQFLQVLMGYTAEQAGKVLSPAGFVMMAMMAVAGRSLGKMDPRIMVALGYMATAAGIYNLTRLDLNSSFGTVTLWRALQVIGLPFVFIPISTLNYVGVPPSKTNQISSLSNFARNLGGSAGTALLTTYLARSGQVRQQALGAHVIPGSVPYRIYMANMMTMLQSAGMSAGQASSTAVGMAYREMQRQASMLAYKNAFFILSVVILSLVPLPFIMRLPAKKVKLDPEAMGH